MFFLLGVILLLLLLDRLTHELGGSDALRPLYYIGKFAKLFSRLYYKIGRFFAWLYYVHVLVGKFVFVNLWRVISELFQELYDTFRPFFEFGMFLDGFANVYKSHILPILTALRPFARFFVSRWVFMLCIPLPIYVFMRYY